MAKKKLIVGNWKMNPSSAEEAKKIIKNVRRAASNHGSMEVVVCPPFPFITLAVSKNSNDSLKLGAQTVSYDESGPHTGEVSASMLKSLGVSYVIVGHSEERKAGDDDATVAKRANKVLEHGLVPIVCVGEMKREENGAHFDYLKNQIKNSLADIPKKYGKNIVLAYEPVWAIGAKEALAPEGIYEMTIFIRKVFADLFSSEIAMTMKILYGGSVNTLNARDIMTIGKVDGLLIGRESVNSVGFAQLIESLD